MLKKILDTIAFLFGFKGAVTDEMVELGLVSFEGQGRDIYGK